MRGSRGWSEAPSAAGVADGTTIRVRSAAGELIGRARTDEAVREGAVCVPHRWPELNVGRLTSERLDVDPQTGMVVQTGIPVSIEAAGSG